MCRIFCLQTITFDIRSLNKVIIKITAVMPLVGGQGGPIRNLGVQLTLLQIMPTTLLLAPRIGKPNGISDYCIATVGL